MRGCGGLSGELAPPEAYRSLSGTPNEASEKSIKDPCSKKGAGVLRPWAFPRTGGTQKGRSVKGVLPTPEANKVAAYRALREEQEVLMPGP